jgi:hypothetical protein
VAGDVILTPFTRERIGRLAEAALQRAGTAGEYPTRIDAVLEAVGVEEQLDIANLPADLEAKKPARWRRVLGAIVFGERTVFVDRTQPQPRRLFTDAHEATHAMCPWHEATLLLDGESTMFRDVKDIIEAEANYGAGRLIFQGPRFHRRALEEQVSMRTPLALAPDYGASMHATLHYYVEEHPDAVALLVAGRYPYWDGTLPIWRSVESPAFLKRHGHIENRLPNRELSIRDDDRSPLGGIVRQSRTAIDPPSTVVGIPDGDGTRVPFVAEAFFNGYCHFVMFVDRKARRLGRRVRLAG